MSSDVYQETGSRKKGRLMPKLASDVPIASGSDLSAQRQQARSHNEPVRGINISDE
jgi:hypothetical protein